MYYMSQQIGIAVSITIMSDLLNRQFEFTLQKLLASIPGYEEVSTILPSAQSSRNRIIANSFSI